MTTLGLDFLPRAVVFGLIAVGAASTAAYVLYAGARRRR